ncbi:hypothetical protein [Brachyspira murdochii]|uniref:Lipoprotein n=1 Tax=Brachyspira murdochii (strain ATCC 51284 / DSM 12563 / 56-150) TaxID=526224 RepID=D5U8X8_BRAM5|nr:hypothetical protein [Brachyspira murdochii]ADG71151.1 conserved hypothetical protein [Brachyspira murdochii DSM 12563]
MSKKISTIFLTLFLVGILSVSCSSKQDPKGIEQYNGNSYVSAESYTVEQLGTGYLWISVKDSKVGISASADNANEPTYEGYFSVTGSGTDYSFSNPDTQGTPNAIVGTLKFSDNSVTLNFTKNTVMPSIENTDIVCNKK